MKKNKTNKQQQNKTKQKEIPTAWLGWGVGAEEKLSQNFGTENLYTNLQSERCDCAIKKKGI